MALLDSLEHRFGRFAIPGITRIIAAGQILMFVLIQLDQNLTFASQLLLDRDKIMEGQVWRLFGYMILPVSLRPISFFFSVWALWWVGDLLEQAWGSFKVNVFTFTGMFFLTVVAFVLNAPQYNWVIMATYFFALATLAPDFQVNLYGILPVAAKWLALISAGFLAFGFIQGGIVTKCSILAGVSNYLFFFGPGAVRNFLFNQRTAARRTRFESAVEEGHAEAMHSCKVCGRTDNTNPQLDFRVARDGEEYCSDHLPSRQS